jgi:drug/metabolite transporter (DMT)-like permease
MFLIGLRTTPATEAGIYQVITPIFVVVIAWLWLHERLSRVRILGIILAAIGSTVLLTGGGIAGLGGGDLTGALFVLGSNLCWGFYTVMSKKLITRRSPLLVLTAANLTAMVATWLIAGLLGIWPQLPSLATWSPTAWAVMLYLVVLVGTSSQWLYSWTIRELGPSRVSAGLYLKPLFVAILATAFLDEVPTLITIVSGLLILAGVWLVNRPQRSDAVESANCLRTIRAPTT